MIKECASLRLHRRSLAHAPPRFSMGCGGSKPTSPTQAAADAYMKAFNAKDAAAAQATFAASVSRAFAASILHAPLSAGRWLLATQTWCVRSHRRGAIDGRVAAVGNNKGIGAPKPMPTEKIIGALKGVMFESFGFTFVDPAVTINGKQAVIDTKLKVDTTLPAWETASGKPAPFPPVPVKEMVRDER
jgi:hypothetical protein